MRLLFVEKYVTLARRHRARRHVGDSAVVVLVPLVAVRMLAVSRVVARVRRTRVICHAVEIVGATLAPLSGKGTEVKASQREVHQDI